MAKRGAERDLNKDNAEEEEEEEVEDPGQRDTPLAPISGRQIRGMPKRKGLGGAAPTPQAAPAPPAAASTSSPFGSFSFGQAASAPSATPSAGFSFGASTSSTPVPAPAAAAAKPSPFGGFSFGKPAASSDAPPSTSSTSTPAFSFGSGSAPSTSTSTSFGQSSAPSTTSTFGFGGSSASTPKTANSSASPFGAPSSGSSFGFGQASDSSKSETNEVPKPAIGFGKSTSEPKKDEDKAEEIKESESAKAEAPKSTSSFSFGQSAPAPPSTSKPAAPFSFGSSSTQKPAEEPKSVEPSTTTAKANGISKSEASDSEIQYWTSIRGLNSSLVSALSNAIKDDPFCDLSGTLALLSEQVTKHREEIAQKSGWRPGQETETKDETKSAAAVSIPKPPSVPTSGFGLLKPSTSTPSGGGFVPTVSAGSSSSPFTFGQPPKEATTENKDAPSGGFSFGQATTAEKKDEPTTTKPEEEETPTPAKSFSFSFGAKQPNTSPSTAFAFGAAVPPKGSPSGPSASSFSFGSSSKSSETPASATTSGFSFGSSTAPKSDSESKAPTAPSSGFSFGSSSTPKSDSEPKAPAPSSGLSFGSSSAPKSDSQAQAAPTSGFSFGSSAPKSDETKSAAPSSGFSFGSSTAPTTSAPSSGFSFGSSSAPKSVDPRPQPASSGFSFGQPAKPASTNMFASMTPGFTSTEKPAETETVKEAPTQSNDTAEGGEASAEAEGPGINLADQAGAGEEGEETVVEQRGKLFLFENGTNAVKGLGQFKLKRAKDAEGGKRKRRLLMRVAGSGNVILNMTISTSFKPTSTGTTVSFLGFDLNGKPGPYQLRVKTAADATKILKALEEEVEALKGESA